MKVKILKVLDVVATPSSEIARQLVVYLNFPKQTISEVLLEINPTRNLQIESTNPPFFKEDKYCWRVHAYPRMLGNRLIYSYGVQVNFKYILEKEIMMK